MAFSLSSVSIHKQILIGYLPVLLILAFLAFSSYQNFNSFQQSFRTLNDVTKEQFVFLEIERDIVELQRNVVVYNYVGYRGVIRKIEFLQKNLEDKFGMIRSIAEADNDIKKPFDRMLGHYHDYKDGFVVAVRERNALDDLTQKKLQPLYEEGISQLRSIEEDLLADAVYEKAYGISLTKQDLSQANDKINGFLKFPDASVARQVQGLVTSIQKRAEQMQSDTSDNEAVDEFLVTLEEYRSIFSDIRRINRVYLNLINVVLAGKAAEIDKLSGTIEDLVAERSEALSEEIRLNVERSRKQFVFLSLVAVFMGGLSSVVIARGIARPVTAMAKTLSDLAVGKAGTEIPAQQRKDEVGKMAKAAQDFKVMAQQLENQTAELEEFAYRTSHDLRSPLVSSIGLLGLAEKAIKEQEYGKAAQSMEFVKGSLERLETLVQDILELTKTKNIDEELKLIDFQKIVETTLQNFKHMDDFEKLDIRKKFAFKGEYRAQKTRVVLIIENLISNAVKYQDASEKQPFISLSTFETPDHVVFEIKDNGLGIPAKQKEHMFQMFRRFHPKASFGSGLGLYMMKKSADVLGAKIVYEDLGDGSQFQLLLPKN